MTELTPIPTNSSDLTISVVGMKYYIKNTLSSFMSEANGRTVLLKIEPDNQYDQKAVKAVFNGERIGHVRKKDNDDYCVFETLVQKNRNCMNGKVVGFSEDGKAMLIKINNYGEPPTKESINEKFTNWNYPVSITFSSEKLSKLKDTIDSLVSFLELGINNAADIIPLLEEYNKLMVFSFSKETNDDRHKIYEMLDKHPVEEVRALVRKYIPFNHDTVTLKRAYEALVKDMKRDIRDNHRSEVTNYVLSEIEQAARKLPFDMYKNKATFATRLFYLHLDNHLLIKVLSCMALCGYLGTEASKAKPRVKKKCGRPKKNRNNPNPVLSYIIGTGSQRQAWFEYMKDMMKDKTNEQAAIVMAAFVKCGILHAPSFPDTEKSFGGIGNRKSYNPSFGYYLNLDIESDACLQNLSDQINYRKQRIIKEIE